MWKPLQDKRIVITRHSDQATNLYVRLVALGATPIMFPILQFVPLPTDVLDAALQQVGVYDWLLFTSSNAVDFFCRRWQELGGNRALPSVAAVGAITGRKLQTMGIIPRFMPDKFMGEQLVIGLGNLTGKRLLWPRAKIGRSDIITLLHRQGAMVVDIPLYDTVTAEPPPAVFAELQQGVDAVTFASPSSVRHFLQVLAHHGLSLSADTAIACIGPVTAEEACKQGLTVSVVADEYTGDGLIHALVNHFKRLCVTK